MTSESNAPETLIPEADGTDCIALLSPNSIPLPESPPPDCFKTGIDGENTKQELLKDEYDPSQPLDSCDEEAEMTHSLNHDDETNLEKENDVPKPLPEDSQRAAIRFSLSNRLCVLPIKALMKQSEKVITKNKSDDKKIPQSAISNIFEEESDNYRSTSEDYLSEESRSSRSRRSSSYTSRSYSDESENSSERDFGSSVHLTSDEDENNLEEEKYVPKPLPEDSERAAIRFSISNRLCAPPINGNTVIPRSAIPNIFGEESEEDKSKLDDQKREGLRIVAYNSSDGEERDKTPANNFGSSTVGLLPAEQSTKMNTVKGEGVTELNTFLDINPEPGELEEMESKANALLGSKEPKLKNEKSNSLREYHVTNNSAERSNRSVHENLPYSSMESIPHEDCNHSDSSERRQDLSNKKRSERKRSYSKSSSLEEGEIITIPRKKKKKGKKSKKKKRRDSRSLSELGHTEETQFDSKVVPNFGVDELDSDNISVSWKKPSKSLGIRNYRISSMLHSVEHSRSKSPAYEARRRPRRSESLNSGNGKFWSDSSSDIYRRYSRSSSTLRSRRNNRDKSVSYSSGRSSISYVGSNRRKEKYRAEDTLKRRKDRKRHKNKHRSKDKTKKHKKKKRKHNKKSVLPVKKVLKERDTILVNVKFTEDEDSESRHHTDAIKEYKSDSDSERKSSKSKIRKSVDNDLEKSKVLKEPVVIDLEESPIPNENTKVSPVVIILSDDDESGHSQSKEKISNRKHDEDTLSSISSDDSVSETEKRICAFGHSIEEAVDLAKARVEALCHSLLTSDSFTRNDSADTAIKDFEETSHSADEESHKVLETQISENHEPKNALPLFQNLSPGNSRGSSTPSPYSSPTLKQLNIKFSPVKSSKIGLTRIPGINSFQGIFPGSSTEAIEGNMPIPAPVGVPSPVGVSAPIINSGLLNPNVLASVANAIYGPFWATGQQSSAVRNMQPSQLPVSILRNQSCGMFPKMKDLDTFSNRPNNNSLQPAGDRGSPISPNSSEGDDLFEPRPQNSASFLKTHKITSVNTSAKISELVGPSTTKSVQNKIQNQIGEFKTGSDQKPRSSLQILKNDGKLKEGPLRHSEEYPSSAAALEINQKRLEKLKRQTRVADEVKATLKPYYQKQRITKDEYKDILRKAVPKICHSKSVQINPVKVKELVDAYVKEFRRTRKRQ